jgi:Ser/Thr protein kinase RdoA (MazF antagonist)
VATNDMASLHTVAAAYGLGEPSESVLIADGENRLYRIMTPRGDYVIRECLRFEQDPEALSGETAWLTALGEHISVPLPLSAETGSTVFVLPQETRVQAFMVFPTIYGYHLFSPDTSAWVKYGSLMSEFHRVADKIARTIAPPWPGLLRPSYGPSDIVDTSDRKLLDTAWIPLQLRADYDRLFGDVRELIGRLKMGRPSLIHFDMHLGNILITDRSWFVLDLEECGFGPAEIDLGVMRLHAIRRGCLDEAWAAFCRGYGSGDLTERAPLGTILKAIFLAGKIVSRLDIPQIARDPIRPLEFCAEIIRQELRRCERL